MSNMKKVIPVLLVCVLATALGGCFARLTSKVSGSVEGNLVWHDGVPAEGVVVMVSGENRWAVADAKGKFIITNVPESRHVLTAHYENAKIKGIDVPVDVVADKTTSVDVISLAMFSDDFSGDKDEWTLLANAAVNDGILSVPSGGRGLFKDPIGAMGIRFTLRGDGNGAMCVNFHNPVAETSSGTSHYDYGYIVWIDKTGARVIKPKTERNGVYWTGTNYVGDTGIIEGTTFEIIKQKAKDSDAETAAHWVIKIDGQVVLDADSPAEHHAANSGYFGFQSRDGGNWQIDDIVMWEIEE
jgi:hypothetical protein